MSAIKFQAGPPVSTRSPSGTPTEPVDPAFIAAIPEALRLPQGMALPMATVGVGPTNKTLTKAVASRQNNALQRWLKENRPDLAPLDDGCERLYVGTHLDSATGQNQVVLTYYPNGRVRRSRTRKEEQA